MTTLLTLLQELPYLKYLDLGENHLSRGALNMLESQLRSMDGVTQTAHTAGREEGSGRSSCHD